MNNDLQLTVCEVHDCVVMCENEWRAEYCPDNMEQLWCTCPYESTVSCTGSWNCSDIDVIALEALAYWDTNSDGQISEDDMISQADLDNINYYCDINGNGATDACEVH